MNWADFKDRHQNVSEAFEAFACQLFSRWCQNEYRLQLKVIYYVGGKGGDGGVEAFAELIDGTVIGLQAKWFRDTFEETQINQIKASLYAAKKRFSKLGKYIVCLPIELQGSRGRGNSGVSQIDRWQSFVDAEILKPDFWGDKKIEEEAIRTGCSALLSYWFSRPFLSLSDWQERHRRTTTAWFRDRYIPDLHVCGMYDEAIQNHLLTHEVREALAKKVVQAADQLAEVNREMVRLPTLADWGQMIAGQPVLTSLPMEAKKGEALFRDFAVGMRNTVDRGTPLVDQSEKWIQDFEQLLQKGIDILVHVKPNMGLSPSYECMKRMEQLSKRILDIYNVFDMYRNFNRPLALLGDPGSGKTHSVVNIVSNKLDHGTPALVIPASAVDLKKPLSRWMSDFLDQVGWNLDDCLIAMEAAAYEADRRNNDGKEGPFRFLLAIDGLEENTAADNWPRVFGELCEALKGFPRITLVCTVRTAHDCQCLSAKTLFLRQQFNGNTQPLHILFIKYCTRYNVDFSNQPWVQWALQSPLDIRLFSQVYQGCSLCSTDNLRISTAPLLNAVVERLETELRLNPEHGWSSNDRVLLAALRNIGSCILEEGDSQIEHGRLVIIIRQAHATLAEFRRDQVNHIIDGCVSHGILTRFIKSANTILSAEESYYSCAYHSLSDFLLATCALNRVSRGLTIIRRLEYILPRSLLRWSCQLLRTRNQMGRILNQRSNAFTLLLQMVNEEKDIYVTQDSVLSLVGLSEDTIRNAQLSALAMSLREPPIAIKNWVRNLFVTNKPLNRKVLQLLIVPTARNKRHWCGGIFAHETLLPLNVVQRDLIWSGPDYLQNTRNAPWEGSAGFDMDDLLLYDSETFNGVPLLLAWNCSSVIAERVRRCRTRLAKWGGSNLGDMAHLIRILGPVNDPQVLENVLVAAAGAATVCNEMTGLATCAAACYDVFFSDTRVIRIHNAITRHAARIVIERAALFHQVSAEVLAAARPPYKITPDKIMPFEYSPENNELINGDLEWYVVDHAISGFFEDSKRESCVESLLEERVPQSLIDAFINGKIPIDTNVQTRIDVIAAAVAEARRKRDDWSSLLKIIGGGLNKVSASFPEKDEAGEKISDKEIKDVQNEVEGVPEKLISEIHDAVQDRSPVPPTYTLEAATLLKHYGSLIGRTTLTPVELRDGLVWAYVKALGWCSDVFIGTPNGGKEGEILGADVAIIRRYHPATHGARSAIASYGEKYIWCAVNEIAGYLADRLPRCKAYRSEWCRVSDYSDVGNGMPDPFDGQDESDYADSEPSPIFFADKFWLPFVPTGDNLLAKCSDWCLHAPWPDPVNFTVLGESTVLFSRLCYNEPENCARQIVTASAFAFERELAEIVKRDVKFDALPVYAHGADGLTCGLSGDQCYKSPSFACWAPWIDACDDTISYVTVTNDGSAREVDLNLLAAKGNWTCGEDDCEYLLPSPKIRESLGIAVSSGGANARVYLSTDAQPVAWFYSGHFRVSEFSKLLRVKSDRLVSSLNTKDWVLGWIVEIYREVPPQFYPETERQNWIRLKRTYVLLSDGKGIQCVWLKENERNAF